jgi:hypothetical protein
MIKILRAIRAYLYDKISQLKNSYSFSYSEIISFFACSNKE